MQRQTAERCGRRNASVKSTPWPGLTARRTLVLPVPRREWALPSDARIIDGMAFVPKRELHITVAGREAVATVERVHGKACVEAVLREAFAVCDWRYRRTHRYLRLRRPQPPAPDAGSIIEPLDLPGLAEFYRALAAAGCDLPVPPAHVTLWTHARPRGIGVADEAALAESYVRDVSAHELGL